MVSVTPSALPTRSRRVTTRARMCARVQATGTPWFISTSSTISPRSRACCTLASGGSSTCGVTTTRTWSCRRSQTVQQALERGEMVLDVLLDQGIPVAYTRAHILRASAHEARPGRQGAGVDGDHLRPSRSST